MDCATPLSVAGIRAGLAPIASGIVIEVVDETGSTNADLLARVATLSMPTLLLACSQTAGRGRAGRSWLSSGDGSLTFSLAWPFAQPMQALSGLPLAVGVALADALAPFEPGLQLKWPNDLLKNGDKLAGILIESAAVANRGIWAVIGIGLNLKLPEQLVRRIGRPAADLPQLAQFDRNWLMGVLINSLADALYQYEQDGLAPFVARWNRLHAHAGLPVKIIDRDVVVERGNAIGIDESGRLLLETPQGRVAVVAGDVSLRSDIE